MLKHLNIRNFTVFAEADFEFSKGLNVIVGTNGTGKSHVLKLGYAVLRSLTSRLRNWNTSLDSPLTSLRDIFRPIPADVSELIRRQVATSALVQYALDDERLSPGQVFLSPEISTESQLIATPATAVDEVQAANTAPVFIPAKEVLSLGWMYPASEQLHLPLDATYLDLLTQLNRLPLKKPGAEGVITQLTQQLGGTVEAEGSRFYLSFAKQKPMDINVVAEGLRKFGTLQRLLSNGSLTQTSTLFWDEPEANLNPALLRKLAVLLVELARRGFQIILATHSLFLLKEFHILAQQEPTPIRYFGLYEGLDGATQVEATDDFETLEHIAALDAELEQTVDFQQALDHDDAN